MYKLVNKTEVETYTESKKLQFVYYCSTRKDAQSPSLNNCLEVGPSLQPLIFYILIRNWMNKLCVLADIQKAFPQFRTYEMNRDAQRLIWYEDLRKMELTVLQLTRVIFGSSLSPYNVPTKENLSDLGTRGVSPEKLSSLWFNALIWLKHKENWPTQLEIVEMPYALCGSIGVKENVGMITEIKRHPTF